MDPMLVIRKLVSLGRLSVAQMVVPARQVKAAVVPVADRAVVEPVDLLAVASLVLPEAVTLQVATAAEATTILLLAASLPVVQEQRTSRAVAEALAVPRQRRAAREERRAADRAVVVTAAATVVWLLAVKSVTHMKLFSRSIFTKAPAIEQVITRAQLRMTRPVIVAPRLVSMLRDGVA